MLAIQALRAALYGFGAVLLGEVLALRGFGPAQAGLVLTAVVAGRGVSSFLVGAIGPRLPTRSLYVGLLLLMGASGLVFAATAWLPALVVAGLTGTISTDPNESGPITTVEQGLIGRSAAPRRLRLFGRYNAIAYLAGAVGSLAAGRGRHQTGNVLIGPKAGSAAEFSSPDSALLQGVDRVQTQNKPVTAPNTLDIFMRIRISSPLFPRLKSRVRSPSPAVPSPKFEYESALVGKVSDRQ